MIFDLGHNVKGWRPDLQSSLTHYILILTFGIEKHEHLVPYKNNLIQNQNGLKIYKFLITSSTS